jgi:diguanylate cyclase (GGDEF)-like protein
VFSEKVFNLSEATGVTNADALNITTSIGVACFPESAESVQDLVKEADAAMYAAKKAGKNCVSLARSHV